MGNSPSKNDPLPNTSANHGSSTMNDALMSNEDLDPDERSSALSSSYLSKYNQSSAINIECHGKYPHSNFLNPNSNSSSSLTAGISPKAKRKHSQHRATQKHDSALDFEIDASMAGLLDNSRHSSIANKSNNVNRPRFSQNDYGSSVESDLSQVFTTTDGKDVDLLLSLGSLSTSPKNSSLKSTEFEAETLVGNLDPISESLESTPRPEKRSGSASSGVISKKDLKLDTINKKMSDISINSSSSSSSSSGSPPLSANYNTASVASASASVSSKSPFPFDIDGMIEKLIEIGRSKTSKNLGRSKKFRDKVPFSNDEIKYVLNKSRSIFLEQPTLLKLSPPVNIVGDLHGQFLDLIRIFENCGYPPFSNYLFLGDYVDRGHRSLETMLLLLCYKIKYPENFFMLRGNHESANITKIYGFYDECKRRLPGLTGNHKVWRSFIDVFNSLPIAATINDKIFCIHGGLSPDLHELQQIEDIKRPTDVPDKGLLADLLWSDPDPSVKSFSLTHWPKNDRGVSYCFGKKHIDYFCQQFNFDLIVRGHMVVEDGYEFFNRRKLVTIFSAPNYCGEFNNYGSVMIVDKALCCSFELIKPL